MCVWREEIWWQVSGSFLFGRLKAGQSSRHSDWKWLGLLESLFRWLFTAFRCEVGIKLGLGTFANVAFLFAFISWHFLNEKALKVQTLPCCFQDSSASTYGEFLSVEANLFFFSSCGVSGTYTWGSDLARLTPVSKLPLGAKLLHFQRAAQHGCKTLL